MSIKIIDHGGVGIHKSKGRRAARITMTTQPIGFNVITKEEAPTMNTREILPITVYRTREAAQAMMQKIAEYAPAEELATYRIVSRKDGRFVIEVWEDGFKLGVL
jgi:hypothetical protein